MQSHSEQTHLVRDLTMKARMVFIFVCSVLALGSFGGESAHPPPSPAGESSLGYCGELSQRQRPGRVRIHAAAVGGSKNRKSSSWALGGRLEIRSTRQKNIRNPIQVSRALRT
jgi:hypothetical protein